MRETFILGEEDLEELASKVGTISEKMWSTREEKRAFVILLEGDLGAGKTTFTKALAKVLGIDHTSVHSPTFILKKEYSAPHHLFKKLVHVDAYRFVQPEESKVLRLEEDLADPGTLVVIEWPSKMSALASDMTIEFKIEDEKTREIIVTYEEQK